MKPLILLVNLGTPDSPSTNDVRRYLSEFLSDSRVIDLPWLARTLLVNGIIAPFRAPRSAKEYQKLWTEKGSPLLFHTKELSEKLQLLYGDTADVKFAMRYGNPSIKEVLSSVKNHSPEHITVVPLYPQNTSSTTGTVSKEVFKILSAWWNIPAVKVVPQFYSHPQYIAACISQVSKADLQEYDHVLFSYHGLPVRHIEKSNCTSCSNFSCIEKPEDRNPMCYFASCLSNTDLLAKALDLSKSQYSMAFQSRLSKNWLTPFADKEIIRLAQKGIKKILVLAPSFVCDCLETTVEIGQGYKELFKQNGGEQLKLVLSLNSSEKWVKALKQIVDSE